jgi:hypothetical protein
MNILYAGVDNPVSIRVSGRSSTAITATITKGVISGSGSEFIVRVDEPGRVTINVYEKMNGGKPKFIDSVVMRVKEIPKPTAFVARKKNGDTISLKKLNDVAYVIPMYENLDFDLKMVIDSFALTILAHGSTEFYFSTTCKITPQMKAGFMKLRSGDKLIFERIYCRIPGENGRSIEPLILTVE